MSQELPTLQPSRDRDCSRRQMLQGTGVLAAAAFLSRTETVFGMETETADSALPALRYCLNTSTINGSKVPIVEQIKIAAEAGYDSIEIWLRDVQRHVDQGGTLKDLAKQLSDSGLAIDSAIAFGNWIVDDAKKRAAGLEQCRKDMEVLRTLGGMRIAAPPVGATKEPGLDLRAAAERYRELLKVGRETGVIPQVELWGFSANLSKLEDVLFVATAADDPDACVLLDVYHLFKGGSDFTNIGFVPGTRMHCLHMNDYPGQPGRAEIGDKDRVYPGDGVAPMDHILQTLVQGGFSGTLSLELFNRTYWAQPAEEVARTGLQKMKACVEKAFR